ncbi:anti-sigma factor [Sediminibacterium sp.]|uniref:anti-sigma factor n=1 Tax=Sediminibacterium sp. TaxID=1917865 RepID=UPI003F6F4AFC
MNTQEYIQNGIIESYVLGMASSAEAAELEQLCLRYPEIKQALTDFELALEAKALSNAVAPPPQLKQQIFSALQSEFVDEKNNNAENSKALITPLNETPVVKINQTSRFLAAASIILLVISGGMNIYFYSKFKETTLQYQALVLEKNTLQANNQIMQTKSLDLYNSMQMMTSPHMLKVSMPGIAGKEANYATVFWDMDTKDVYILPNKLPLPANGKQYQLWAIVDGKPVDAGVINDCAGLCKMKNIPSASMFAITLEKSGGSATPTLSEMYVAGKVG